MIKHIYIFVILINFLIIKNSFAQQGFFLNDWQPKIIDSPAEFTDFTKPSEVSDLTLIIDFSDTLTKVPKYVFGNNANTYSTIMWNNAKLVNDLRNLDIHVLRYPGGNLSNEFFWDRAPNNKPSDIPNDVNVWYGKNEENWTMSVGNYYRLLDTLSVTGIITINYAYARYGTSSDPVSQAAHYAADWVRYDNGRTKFWEIGNENFGNWNKGYQIDQTLNKDGQPKIIDGGLYGRHALVFADSMKAAAAEIGNEIFIGFQAYDEETSWDAVQTNWNEKMMAVVGDAPDFYIVHNYFTPYDQNSNADVILDSYTKTVNFKNQVNKDLNEIGLAPKPVALTEFNIFAVGSKQMISNINGMHSALVIGEAIKQEYGLVNRWNLANGWSEGNDHGAFARGEPNVNDFTPYPTFYHMTFFQKYFGDVLVKSKFNKVLNSDITAFTSSFNSGQAGIALFNTSSNNKTLKIDLQNFEAGENIYWYQLQDEFANGNFSSKVFINGNGPNQASGGPNNYSEIPPYSFSIEDSIKINCPPFSAIYMLIDGKTIVNVENTADNLKPEIFELYQNYPNPFNPSTIIRYSIPKKSNVSLKVYDLLGKEIATLVNSEKLPGNYEVEFSAYGLASGVYFYKLNADNFSKIKKLMILK